MLGIAEKSADFVGTYNHVRLLKLTGLMMAGMQQLPVELRTLYQNMSQIDIESKSNLAFAGKMGNRTATVEIALPKEHLLEIKTAFEELTKQFTPPQQTQTQTENQE